MRACKQGLFDSVASACQAWSWRTWAGATAAATAAAAVAAAASWSAACPVAPLPPLPPLSWPLPSCSPCIIIASAAVLTLRQPKRQPTLSMACGAVHATCEVSTACCLHHVHNHVDTDEMVESHPAAPWCRREVARSAPAGPRPRSAPAWGTLALMLARRWHAPRLQRHLHTKHA